MTELENLAARYLSDTAQDNYWKDELINALATAYQLGRASVNTPARIAAARANGAKNTNFRGGRKPGSKDKAPRKPGRWAHKQTEQEMKP